MTPIPKTKIIHYCTQEEAISRINLILVGNGHPEDGIAYKVLQMAKTHESILASLEKIDNNIKELSDKYDIAIDCSKTAKNAIDNYKREVEQFEKGKEVILEKVDKWGDKKHSKIIRIATLIGVVISAILLSLTVYNSFKPKTVVEETIQTPTSIYSPIPAPKSK
jgi:hypothetical protein